MDAAHVDYIMPGDCGDKADTHWAALANSKGEGLLVRYLCKDEP